MLRSYDSPRYLSEFGKNDIKIDVSLNKTKPERQIMSKRQQSDPADLWVVGGKWEKDRSVATFRSYYEFCPQCGWWL